MCVPVNWWASSCCCFLWSNEVFLVSYFRSVGLPDNFIVNPLQTENAGLAAFNAERISLVTHQVCSWCLSVSAGCWGSKLCSVWVPADHFPWLVSEVGAWRMSPKHCRVTWCFLTPLQGFCMRGGRKEGQTEILQILLRLLQIVISGTAPESLWCISPFFSCFMQGVYPSLQPSWVLLGGCWCSVCECTTYL